MQDEACMAGWLLQGVLTHPEAEAAGQVGCKQACSQHNSLISIQVAVQVPAAAADISAHH